MTGEREHSSGRYLQEDLKERRKTARLLADLQDISESDAKANLEMIMELFELKEANKVRDFIGFDCSEYPYAQKVKTALLDEMRDDLTGLLKQAPFYRQLNESIAICRRLENDLSIILFDIDHFRRFNNTYGHQTGDLVLHAVAREIDDAKRKTDYAFRYGGEEFAIVCMGTDSQGAYTFAEKLRENVECMGGTPEPVTISLGVAQYTFPRQDSLEELDGLVSHADIALYNAKYQGRNKTIIYEPYMFYPPSEGEPASMDLDGKLEGHQIPQSLRAKDSPGYA